MAKVVKCVICGEPFVQHPVCKLTCSRECSKELNLRRNRDRHPKTWLESVKSERKAKAESRRARLARRDAEYAVHAAPVTSVERDGIRIETRGNRFCGSLSGVHRQLVTDYGVVYVS